MKIDLRSTDGFNLASAMRGPDITGYNEKRDWRYANEKSIWSAADAVKVALTARLRFLALGFGDNSFAGAWHVGGAVLNGEPVPDDAPSKLAAQVLLLLKHDTQGTGHCLRHIEKGARALAHLLGAAIYEGVEVEHGAIDALIVRRDEATRLADLVDRLLKQKVD